MLLPDRREVAAQTDKQWLMLAVLLLGQFMDLLDVFVVNVALPTIGAGLDASGASAQLVVGEYTVAYAMLLIRQARLGALRGGQRTSGQSNARTNAPVRECWPPLPPPFAPPVFLTEHAF